MLSSDEVKKIATLARIGLREEEIEKYRHDLSTVLGWFEKLQKVETENIPSIGHITGRENVTHEDIVLPATLEEKAGIIKNMPETKDGYTKVRSVF